MAQQAASDDPDRIFNAVRAVIAECGVVAGKHRRVLDSTVLDDAVARQDTVTMLVTQIRRVRKLIPALAGVWVREHNLEPGRPPCDWGDPADVDRLVSELVDDANELMWAAEDLVAQRGPGRRGGAAGPGRRPGCRTWRWARAVADRPAHRA